VEDGSSYKETRKVVQWILIKAGLIMRNPKTEFWYGLDAIHRNWPMGDESGLSKE